MKIMVSLFGDGYPFIENENIDRISTDNRDTAIGTAHIETLGLGAILKKNLKSR